MLKNILKVIAISILFIGCNQQQNKELIIQDIEEETGYEFSKVNLKPYPWDQCIKEQTVKYGAIAATPFSFCRFFRD